MAMILFNFIVIPVLLQGIMGLEYRYVTPNSPSDIICPGLPCLSLGQYVELTERYFTTGSTFVFLPGNHSLESVLSLENVSDVTMRGVGSGSTARIFLGRQVTIFCDEVQNIRIEGLTFILCSYQCISSAMQILDSAEIVISDSIFQGSGKEPLNTVNSIHSHNSNFTVLNCLFEGNTGSNGGAIESWNGSIHDHHWEHICQCSGWCLPVGRDEQCGHFQQWSTGV